MKNKTYVLPLVLLIGCLGFFSCSNDEDSGDVNTNGNPSISMKVNGKSWESTTYAMNTEQRETEEIGDYYLVSISGQQVDVENKGNSSSLNLFLVVPIADFNNPKGEYPLLAENEAKAGDAIAHFFQSNEGEDEIYESMEPSNPKTIVGKVQLNEYKVGELTVGGHSTGRMGYTALSGTFEMNLHPLGKRTNSSLQVTEGRFKLKSSAGVDF